MGFETFDLIDIYVTVYSLQKSSYPNVFFPALLKTVIIDKPIPALFEIAIIGNAFTVTQDRRFTNRCNRRPIAAVFKNTGIGSFKLAIIKCCGTKPSYFKDLGQSTKDG